MQILLYGIRKKELSMAFKYSHHRTDYNLYEGWDLVGFPEKVLLRGKVIVDGDQWLGKPGSGNFIYRKPFSTLI